MLNNVEDRHILTNLNMMENQMEIFRVYIRYENEKDRHNLQLEHSIINSFLYIYMMKIKCLIRIESLSSPDSILIKDRYVRFIEDGIFIIENNNFIAFLLPYIIDYYDDNAKEYGFVESEHTISELIEIYSGNKKNVN